MNKKTNSRKYLNMTNDLFNRRNFFSQVLNQSTAPFKSAEIDSEYQGITYIFSQKSISKEILVFTERNTSIPLGSKGLGRVSFLNWPHGKTDNFFKKLLNHQKSIPQKCYAITSEIPLKSLKFWDRIVWISQEIPAEIPAIKCPVLIVQDISHFNPERSPAELLPQLPAESDIFISQHLDLSDKNNPAIKRIYDFLGA